MNLGREDDLAGGTLSCTSELETAAQLRGIVDDLETLIAKVEDTHSIGNNRHEDDHVFYKAGLEGDFGAIVRNLLVQVLCCGLHFGV